MMNIKRFKCANLCCLRDSDLLAIATSMLPFLEELDISYPKNNNFDSSRKLGEFTVTDTGIEALWSGLRNLRVLNISGNHFITDRSVVGLSLNCLLLREICILDCSFITYSGLQFMLCNSSDLNVILVNGVQIPSCVRSSAYGRALTDLYFADSIISDEFLRSIANASLPLKRFTLSRCTNFTFLGISLLFYTYQALDHLSLVEAQFLTDQCMGELAQFLKQLVSIKLDSCSKLTNMTFFTLVDNCRLLESIDMSRTSIGKEDYFVELINNHTIKSLNLAKNVHLTDACLVNIASVCPNLELLDLSANSGITEESIGYVLKACCEIRHLQITDCAGVKNLGTGTNLPKLEVLHIARSGFDDEGFVNIWNRCSGLRKLDMEGCMVATTKRVEEIVRNCVWLKEINLKGCYLDVYSVATWTTFSKPSVMKIIAPRSFSITSKLQKLLLNHGCLLSSE